MNRAVMFLRYFACTDESPLGYTAAKYCDALVDTGLPVRLVPTRVAELQQGPQESPSLWERHRGLLVTPMDGKFINLVCAEVADWARCYTLGVTNALLLSAFNFGDSMSSELIVKYEFVYSPSRFVCGLTDKLTGVVPIRVPIGDPNAADAFRNLMVF